MKKSGLPIYRSFSRKCLYPLYETFAGRRFLDKLAFLEQSQWWDGERLRKYQWEKIRKLLNYVFKKNSYYRRKLKQLDIHPQDIKDFADFTKIPILTKEDITKNATGLISDDYDSKSLPKDVTSGSTGKNLVFYMDPNSLDYRTAAVLRNMLWYDIHLGDKRIKLWGSPIRDSARQRTYMALRNILLREHIISAYQMDTRKTLDIIRKIRRVKPKALIGYVSALEILAKFVEKNQIQDIKVNAIIPAAETLFEHQRKLFEQVFHGEVFNRYGSHEFTGIAHECSLHDGMHINCENLYLEVIKDGRLAAPGEMGEIIITDLENFASPFIRYQIEDLGVLRDDQCRCGRGLPLLDRVEGRVYDLISCPNGAIQTGTFFCKVTRSVDGIDQFQVIQESQDRIRLKLVTDGYFQLSSTSFLKEVIQKYCGEGMKVEFEFVDQIDPLSSGKRRYIVSLESATL